MRPQDFTADEVELFERTFERTPAWTHWHRHSGRSDTSVIVVRTESQRQSVLKLSKTPDGRFAALGFGGWTLTVCDGMAELLDVVAPKPAAAALAA